MPPDDPFDTVMLSEFSAQITSLKARLPRDSVESLAREVILRVGRRRESRPLLSDAMRLSDQIDRLSVALIDDDDAEAGLAFVQAARRAGADVETVYYVLLAEAARRLGQWWTEDQVSLTDVTIGCARIFSILRALDVTRYRESAIEDRSAMFAAVPGENHTLGVRMAADMFRRDDWSIDLLIGAGHEDIVDHAQQTDAGIVGLSSGGRATAMATSRLVVALRMSVPLARILLSGRILVEDPGLVAEMAPDGTAIDIEEARQVLNGFRTENAGQTPSQGPVSSGLIR